MRASSTALSSPAFSAGAIRLQPDALLLLLSARLRELEPPLLAGLERSQRSASIRRALSELRLLVLELRGRARTPGTALEAVLIDFQDRVDEQVGRVLRADAALGVTLWTHVADATRSLTSRSASIATPLDALLTQLADRACEEQAQAAAERRLLQALLTARRHALLAATRLVAHCTQSHPTTR